MARQDAGKWVARAGATGGGRTYRARVPYRWYSGLALIVVLGVFLVAYSRYERLHPAQPVQPTTSTHWAAGVVFDLCGKNQTVAASPALQQSSLGLYSSGGGVIQIQPKTSADSGTNATLGRFTSQYTGLTLTGDSVGLPKQHVYTNGSVCPSGTPDAGKKGELLAKIIPPPQSNESSTTQTGDLRTVRFTANGEIVTVAFIPSGASVAAPGQAITVAVEDAAASAVTPATTSTVPPIITSTTTPGVTTTTAKGTTTTTAKVTTTTTSGSTTTTSAGTTTTSG